MIRVLEQEYQDMLEHKLYSQQHKNRRYSLYDMFAENNRIEIERMFLLMQRKTLACSTYHW